MLGIRLALSDNLRLPDNSLFHKELMNLTNIGRIRDE